MQTIQQVPSAQSRPHQRADSQDHGPFRSIKRGWRISLLSTRVESVGCLSLVFFFYLFHNYVSAFCFVNNDGISVLFKRGTWIQS